MTNLLSQELKKFDGQGSKKISDEYKSLIRKSAAEGIVMLKNNGVLPLGNEIISVFGRVQQDYFYVGNGSGGDVNPPYLVNFIQGLDNSKLKYDKELAKVYADWCEKNPADNSNIWGQWPTHHSEMPLSNEIKTTGDVAAVVIGRCAGEDRDSLLEEGSFFLTREETQMLDVVTRKFEKVILIINSGNIIDFSWYEKYESKISALLYVWQGGMESGNAICDVLCGDVNPSSKLPTSIAKKYEDYPTAQNFGDDEFNNYAEDIFVGYRYFESFAKDAVLFPFGFGLSYTNFEICGDVSEKNGNVTVNVNVKNIGNCQGAEVVQIYYSAPQGVLGKPARELAAFAKTNTLQAGSSQNLKIEFPMYYMASYDDGGKVQKSAYVLESGEYEIFAGSCVRSAKKIGAINVGELIICEQLEEAAAPEKSFTRMTADKKTEDVPTRTVSLKERVLANLPKEIPPTDDLGYKLQDVADGKISLESFVAQLNMYELEGLTRGDYIMGSALGTAGNAGVFGGVTASLREKGVIPITTTDGPSGIRLEAYCALLPCGLALASTWNTELLTALATFHGEEFATKGSHVLLAPGMNILRDPLCGRNFEYFSEDPILSGKIAASVVTGLQKHGGSACPKHFAANNQEKNRTTHDSRVSERALREIYLKGFELCVKESAPRNIMTSYNKINGVWGHYHYELCTTILRGEWGYEGNLITDWWMRPSVDPNFPDVFNDAYRVRAQVDVLMPGGRYHGADDGDGSLLKSFAKENGITLAEIQRCAMNVLRFVLSV
jgi:beta-glucosidase